MTTEPDATKNRLVIYHGPECWDGFCGAWLIHRFMPGPTDFHPAQYGEPPPDVRGRLIIPVHLRGEFVGWQALRVDGQAAGRGPDCLTAPGMRRSQLLYNLDRARK